MIVGDVLDEPMVRKTIAGSDYVYNFAGISDIEEASSKPLESVRQNILGTTIILEGCRKAKVKRFLFASSLYVYSKAGSFYRSTKQACESLIENYQEVYGLPYTILRYGSLYGPRSSENNFVHRVLRQALSEGKISREGDGEEIREYIHAFDAARATVDILSKEFVNQCVIISGEQSIKVKDFLLMVREMLDNKIKIKYLPPKMDYHYEITPYMFSPRLAKKVVCKTYVDLGQGVLKCLEEIYKETGMAGQEHPHGRQKAKKM
jgi:UDP-glucose 4-epimerase